MLRNDCDLSICPSASQYLSFLLAQTKLCECKTYTPLPYHMQTLTY